MLPTDIELDRILHILRRIIEHICDGVPEGVWDDTLATPLPTPGDLQNIPNRQTKLIIEEATKK